MRKYGVIFSFLFLGGGVAFKAQGAMERSLRLQKVSGSCSLKERKEKENCPLDLPEEPAKEFSYFHFSPKESAKVKSTSVLCSEKLLNEILALHRGETKENTPEPSGKSVEKIAGKVPGPRFDPEACTVLTKTSAGPQLAILELREFEEQSAPAPETLQRQILVVSLTAKGQAEKIIRRFLSVDAGGAEKSLFSLQGLCDMDGDQYAEMVLSEELFRSSHYIVFNLSPDFKDVSEKRYLASGGCSLEKF